jgi:hypothetical protein
VLLWVGVLVALGWSVVEFRGLIFSELFIRIKSLHLHFVPKSLLRKIGKIILYASQFAHELSESTVVHGTKMSNALECAS